MSKAIQRPEVAHAGSGRLHGKAAIITRAAAGSGGPLRSPLLARVPT